MARDLNQQLQHHYHVSQKLNRLQAEIDNLELVILRTSGNSLQIQALTSESYRYLEGIKRLYNR